MKYITVKLTEEQGNFIINALEQSIYTGDISPKDPMFNFDWRIINKLKKLLNQ